MFIISHFYKESSSLVAPPLIDQVWIFFISSKIYSKFIEKVSKEC